MSFPQPLENDSLSASAKPANDVDSVALLIDAIARHASELHLVDRYALAELVLQLGGYEAVGDDAWARAQSARARFAVEVAARLLRD